MPRYEALPLGEEPQPDLLSLTSEVNESVGELNKGPQVHAGYHQNEGHLLQQAEVQNEKRCIHVFVLAGLAFLFASISITVGLLYHFSQIKDGLTTEQASRRYLWIYGPTAAIVLVRVFWRVIDLKVKQSTPWHELAHGPASADKTILLEYLSLTVFGNVWRSMKNRHWAVTTTILGNLIILLMIVFATGLFALEATTITEQQWQFTHNRFNGSAYNSSQVGASPAILNLAIRTQNLSYPKGTTESTLLPLFEPVGFLPRDATYQASVSGMELNMDCEVLDIKNASITKETLPWFSIGAPYFVANLSIPNCKITNVRLGSGPSGTVYTENQTQSYGALLTKHVCNSEVDDSLPHHLGGENEIAYNRTQTDRTLDDRILIRTVDYGMPPTDSSEKPGIWINSITALLCKPSYGVNMYRVEYAQNSTKTKINLLDRSYAQLPGFYTGDITKAIYTMFSDYANLYLGMGGVDFKLSDAVPPFFQMIELDIGGQNGNITLKDLMDPSVLKPRAEALMKSAVVQLLHMNILTDMSDAANDVIEGTATFSTQRLHIKALSAGFLCAGFSTMTILCLALIFVLPSKLRSKKAIGSAMVVVDTLLSSPNMIGAFAASDQNELKSELKSRNYSSHRVLGTDSILIDRAIPSNVSVTVAAKETKPSKKDERKNTSRWWRPASSRTWFTATAVALALSIIGVLEGIQYMSDRHQGFVGVRSMDISTTVLAQYIPAAIALAISLMFGSIELIVAAISPYATLARGNAPASRTLSVDYLTKSGPHIFILSLMNGHVALSVILVTTFVASFLSIVIPGLYSHINLPLTVNTTALQVDKFDPTGIDISLNDNRAANMINLLTYYNIGYPQWSYDDLAIPQFSVPSIDANFHESSSESSATLSVQTEAIRARLRCEPALTKTIWKAEHKMASNVMTGDSYWLNISAESHLPWSMCSNPPSRNGSAVMDVPFNRVFLADNGTTSGDTVNIGMGRILDWGQAVKYTKSVGTAGDAAKSFETANGLDPKTVALADWGCPSLIFTLGTATLKKRDARGIRNSSSTFGVDADVGNIVCWQNLESVKTNVTLRYPDLAVTADHPPQPDDSTVRWLQSLTAGPDKTTFQFAPNNLLITLNNPNGSRSAPFRSADDVDRFTQAMVYTASKEDNLTLSDIAGSANIATLQNAAQKVYGRDMAQVLSSNMRVDFARATPEVNLTDTLWIPAPSTTTPESNATSNSRRSPPTAPHLRGSRRRANDDASPTVSAVLTQPGSGARVRMIQNRGPKIALQAMLGCMAVGAIVARLLVRTRKVLPHEPYSIAGRAMLVANGNMLAGSADEQRESGGSRLYRLGWWKGQDGVERYGIQLQK